MKGEEAAFSFQATLPYQHLQTPKLTFRLTPLIFGSPSIFLSNLPIDAVAVLLNAMLLSNSSFLASLNVFFCA